ncbi:S8 family serine peptidase, partial [Vulcanococcus sp. Clear-D1]|uniref:S8 family serine peptidase n=1 Tax=Vulcanococcus sp. Clear-D1 TaxID=2766970 RepID=UPI0019A831C2
MLQSKTYFSEDLTMTNDLVVVLRRNADPGDLRQLAQTLDVLAVQDFEQLGMQRWTIKADRSRPENWLRCVEQLKNSPLVRSVVPDQHFSLDDFSSALPNDPLLIVKGGWGYEDQNIQWSLINNGLFEGSFSSPTLYDADIDAAEAWQFVEALPGEPKETIVAVFDTGIDWAHPDLQANMWTNPGEVAGNRIDDDNNGYIDDVHGYDFANHDPDPMDSDPESSGHGLADRHKCETRCDRTGLSR